MLRLAVCFPLKDVVEFSALPQSSFRQGVVRAISLAAAGHELPVAGLAKPFRLITPAGSLLNYLFVRVVLLVAVILSSVPFQLEPKSLTKIVIYPYPDTSHLSKD